jgi:hypothetical protein
MRKKIGIITSLLLVAALAVPLLSSLPVLAAASVASITGTAFGSDATNHNVTMPAAVNSGDLLIVLFANDGNATVTTPGGWNLLTSNSSSAAVRLSAYYKIAAGTEGGTLVNFVTSATEQAAAQVYRITSWHGTTPPEISSNASSSTTPNPPSLNPAGWDVEETLWIAAAGVDGTPSGGTSYPASYGNGTRTESGGGQNCMVISANRILTAASEDPGQFTNGDGAKDWVACTIAVRPACTTYYRDHDGDSYGNSTDNSCLSAPSGEYTALVGGDCNDNDVNEHPGQTWYKDADNDGYSDGTTNTTSCTRPAGYKVASELTATSGDCDDNDVNEHPGQTWYKDADGDGYSDGTTNTTSCTRPADYKVASELTATSGDCDDNDADVYPGHGCGAAPITPVGGTAYPINKLIILLPWMALAAAVIAGIVILARRRRAQS